VANFYAFRCIGAATFPAHGPGRWGAKLVLKLPDRNSWVRAAMTLGELGHRPCFVAAIDVRVEGYLTGMRFKV
jgi:hypothetical protein